MNAIQGVTTKGRTFGVAAAALAVGLAIGPTSLAESAQDLQDAFGNTIQVNAGGDQVLPQFALWPLTGPNTADIHYESNDATARGSEPTKPVLFDFGAGNIAQFSTGGNLFVPQVAVGTDNDSVIRTFGNYAKDNGASQSVTGGQVLGHVIDANGNVFQLEFFQGNVVNPQFAVMGDNTADILTSGNVADGNGGNTSGLALVNAQGNVVQLVILSHNVINPQVSVGGSNDLTITSAGNVAQNNGGSVVGIAGVFTITKVGNVTQIAILSNNVWAPQVVLPDANGNGGTNKSDVVTDTNDADASGSTVDLPNGSGGGPIDVGNVKQGAVGDGIISNPQLNLAHAATTPDAPPADPPADPAPEVKAASADPPKDPPSDPTTDGNKVVPTVLAGDGKGTSSTTVHPTWHPGDGIKAVLGAIHDALTPKPAATGTGTGTDTGTSAGSTP